MSLAQTGPLPMIDAITTADGDLYFVIDEGSSDVVSVTLNDGRPSLFLQDGGERQLPRLVDHESIAPTLQEASIIVMNGYRIRQISKVPLTLIR